jgi:hypothetical protein
MARIKVQGLDDYAKRLEQLGSVRSTNRVIKSAIYDGAAVVADAMKDEASTIPVVPENAHGDPAHQLNGATAAQIRGLQEGLGVARMLSDGNGWNTKVSFDGYNSTKTAKYPGGQPNAMIAASIEAGTSFRRKNPFITRAIRKAKASAEAAMAATADEVINQIMEGN